GRVNFDYVGHNQDGSSTGIYEGQVTQISYPDGTSEYFGYNDAGELAWRRRGDGTIVTVTSRDAQHRITRLDYPTTPIAGTFAETFQYDEFGRLAATTDAQGSTNLAYDALDRL